MNLMKAWPVLVFLLLIPFVSLNKKIINVVNIYGWYGVFPQEVIKQFEKEFNIKVIFDAFDNNNVLETNLLSGTSCYDIVFPSFIPYASRQVSIDAFDCIDYNYIPNISNIDGHITEKFKSNNGNLKYLIPMFWGTIGIVYNDDVIKKVFNSCKSISYNDLFSPIFIQKIAPYGISFPEEYIDILPQVNALLNNPPEYLDIKCLNIFEPIRKYIKKFNSSTIIYDLLSGEICLAICSSDHAWKAKKAAINKTIKYDIPKGITPLWIDCIAIPKKARHKQNAYKFINFILRPEISAQITNYSGILMNVNSARQFIRDDIKNDKNIYPIDEIDNFIMGMPIINEKTRKYDKQATRAWAKVKLNKW